MINHKHKCIFIHIQRTAGSSLEAIIDGKDWWETKELQPQKHLLASQSKKLYKEHWNDYFKFSIVRNPWARMVSMLRPWGFFVKEEAGLLNISEYKNRYGFPATTEFDTRFHNKADIPIGKEGFGYSNILDEEMDFIGKYENLEEDTRFIFKSINLNKKFIVLIKMNMIEAIAIKLTNIDLNTNVP